MEIQLSDKNEQKSHNMENMQKNPKSDEVIVGSEVKGLH